MDFPSPADILLNRVTQGLLSDVMEVSRAVNTMRPLSEDVLESIRQKLLGVSIYNSNAIEGNRLTLRETRAILESAESVDVGRERDRVEVLNLQKAIQQVQQLVEQPDLWSDLSQFTAVHRLLMSGVDDEVAGSIRGVRVRISGAKYQPPRSEQVMPLLEKLFGEMKQSQEFSPVLLATWVHWSIARIHPFGDGNGRMARLWQDLILFGNGLTSAVIRAEQRDDYYRSLEAADEGDFNPLVQLIARSLNRTLQFYLNAQREREELEGWAETVTSESTERTDDLKLEYLRWVQSLEALKDAFNRCAAQITQASKGDVEIQVQDFPVIDQPTWETLRSGHPSATFSFLHIQFERGPNRVEYNFRYAHQSSVHDTATGIEFGPSVAVLAAESESDETTASESQADRDDFPFQKLLVLEGTLAQLTLDERDNSPKLAADLDPMHIAREFVEAVVRDGL